MVGLLWVGWLYYSTDMGGLSRVEDRKSPAGGALGTRLFFLDKFNDVAHSAIQNVAQRIQRFGADGFPVLHAVERVGGYALLENEIIFGQIFLVESLIEGFVADHGGSPSEKLRGFLNFIIVNLLTILNNLSIMVYSQIIDYIVVAITG